MPTNDYVPWATGGGANVETQAAYVADSTRPNGEVSGKANSARANKIWRQASMWATALGLFLNDQGQDALDDGNPSNLMANLKASILSWINASSGVPTGTVAQFAGSVAPTGWLLCDGSAVLRTGANANLFALIGTTYGAGNGSTTFNLPDGRGRVLAGMDPGNTTNRLTGVTPQGVSAAALANNGGEQAHVQTNAELVSHNHSTNEAPHAHSYTEPLNTTGNGSGGNPQPTPGTGATTGSTVTGLTINPNGGGNPFNVVQPTLIVNHIIKL